MSVEAIVGGAALIGVLMTGLGLILSWRRNGTHQAERDITHAETQAARDATLETNQIAILDRLDNKENGLQAVNLKIVAMAERVKVHDRELRDLKKKR
tara:strand:- start:4024 stop:4317 length:294 start_codon:yes stop_codon:yes gene_type:complete